MLSEQTRNQIRELADYFDSLGRLELSAARIEALHQLSSEHPARRCLFVSHRDRVDRLYGVLLGNGQVEIAEHIDKTIKKTESVIEVIAASCLELYADQSNRLTINRKTPYGYAHEAIMDVVSQLVDSLRAMCGETPSEELTTKAGAEQASPFANFMPTPADLDIEQAIRESPTTVTQADIVAASGHPRSTVQARLQALEEAGRIHRPNGPRKGYAIAGSTQA